MAGADHADDRFMAKMRAVQVSRPKAALEVVEREVPKPGSGTVRIRVEACGVCHSDSVTVEGLFPGIEYPRVPGHEVIGTVDALGPGVTEVALGQRVGVGWNGGYDGRCEACRRGQYFACRLHLATGVSSDGGYAEYMIARQEALALVPEGMGAGDAAAPLLCAGTTTFNALRNSGARPGDVVAVQGVGGLGHLGVQYAARMGFATVAIARGRDKEELARKLGAWRYIDSVAQNPASELTKLGGAKVILSTVVDEKAMSDVVGGLANEGKLLVVGIPGKPIEVLATDLLLANRSIAGWYCGTSIDSQDNLAFSMRTGVSSMNETFPLERAADAYRHMMSGKARFRVVLTMG
jgi:D-arabinose 1-dehydrogenase-like Zn-dependent alcohol dehydrogenase